MIRKQFRKLKTGAKRVFVGLVVLCLISSGTGIGSLFVRADEFENHVHNLSVTDNGNGTHTISCAESGCDDYPVTEGCSYNSEGVCLVCGATSANYSNDQTIDGAPQNDGNGDDQGNNGSEAGLNDGADDGSGSDDGSNTSTEDGQSGDNSGSAQGTDESQSGNASDSDGKSGDGASGDGSTSDTGDAQSGDGTDSGSEVADDQGDGTGSDDTQGIVDTDNAQSSDGTDNSQGSDGADNQNGDGTDNAQDDDGTDSENTNTQNDDDSDSDAGINDDQESDSSASDALDDEDDSISDSTTDSSDKNKNDKDKDNKKKDNNSSKKNATSTFALAAALTDDGFSFDALAGVSVDENGNIDYAASTVNFTANPFTISYNGTELTEGTDYTVDLSQVVIPSAPLCGSEYEIIYKGKGAYSGSISKKIVVNDIKDLSFDGSTEKKSLYVESVRLAATGYTLCLSENGDYVSPLVYSVSGDTSPTVYFQNDLTGKKVKTVVSELEIGEVDISNTEYVTFSLNENILYGDKINYLKVSNYSNTFTLTYKKPDGDTYTLIEGKDYEITAPGIADPMAASLEDTYKLRIIGTGNFTGYIERDVIVPPVDVTINGAAEKKSLYIKEVTISPADPGYSISLDVNKAFESQVIYKETGKNQEIPIYIKNKDTGRIVLQRVTDVSISYPELLFDGKPTMDNYYEGCVNLSATDFKVTKVVEKDGEITKVNKDYYIRNTVGTGQNFTIYFMDSTGLDNETEIPVEVKGLDIYEGMDIEVLYNGESYKKWFNTTVKITAPGYMISKHGKNKYAKTYKVSKEGKNSISLDFKNSVTVKNYTLKINIDKGAPTGKITVNEYTSKKFKEKDETGFVTVNSYPIKITFDDELSGKDYAKYYISEKFYPSISEVLEATKSDSSAWKTYSSKNKPSLNIDKKNYIYVMLYDKAGNYTALSTNDLICDTQPPVIVSAAVTKDESGNTVAAIGGQDKLGGIEYFKLLWREKNPNNTSAQFDKPSKTEVEEKGAYVEVKDSKEDAYVGTYTVNDLDLTKSYEFYVVAVDNAGNISEVAKANLDKKLADEIKKLAKEKTGSSSAPLTPAANGIAGGGSPDGSPDGGTGGGAGGSGAAGGASGGSGSGGAGGKSGSGDKSSSSKDSIADTIAQREIKRDPYISNATGSTKIGEIETSGWKNIIAEIRKADHGSMVEVDMRGLSIVPAELFRALKDRPDMFLRLKMSDDVIWQINGSDITADSFVDTDLGVVLGSKNIPARLLSDIVDVYPHVEFEIKTEGELGFTATLLIPVDAANAGMNATLYYYNSRDKDLIVSDTAKVGNDGYARYKLSHCSDYSVVVTPVNVLPGENKSAEEDLLIAAAEEADKDTEVFEGKDVRLTDILSLGRFRRAWLFIIALISAALCVAILMIPGFKQDES